MIADGLLVLVGFSVGEAAFRESSEKHGQFTDNDMLVGAFRGGGSRRSIQNRDDDIRLDDRKGPTESVSFMLPLRKRRREGKKTARAAGQPPVYRRDDSAAEHG
jgi:hypothetical protein